MQVGCQRRDRSTRAPIRPTSPAIRSDPGAIPWARFAIPVTPVTMRFPAPYLVVFAVALALPVRALAQEAWESLPVVEGQGRPSVPLPRADATIEVDAVLDEPVWGQALRLGGFWQYEPVDGIRAEEQTDVLIWYSANAVHIGIVAHDRNPSSIRATRADRDAIGNDDHVVVYLDTFDDQRRAFFFGVNPYGVQMDGVRTEGGVGAGNVFGGVIDDSPD